MINKEQLFNGIALAKSVANLSECKKEKIGIVFMYGKKVISDGYNIYKSNVQYRYYLTRFGKLDFEILYAEEMALQRCINMDIDFTKVVAYICKINEDNSYGNARPNDYCLKLLHWRGIQNIYYTSADGSIGRAL